ncbi:hypothetical protein GOODEAATRI_002977 [Goodea atripinnis]|uniref:Uncharacterized protein n=1 Tax=Goodea atripinnis TaxID=208336 RepID=A0ABV0MNV1_9TELE
MAASRSPPGLAMVRHLTSLDAYSTVGSSCTWGGKTETESFLSDVVHDDESRVAESTECDVGELQSVKSPAEPDREAGRTAVS